MKRWATMVVGVGLIAAMAVVAPAANAATALIATKAQPVIAMSDRSTCAIRESHRVYCWGANSQGELGRGTTSSSTAVTPVVPFLSNAIAIYGSNVSAGDGGSFCALRITRTIECWGSGAYYRLGTGTTSVSSEPVVVEGIDNVATMSMGYTASCVAKQDGSVWCVGSSTYVVPPSGSTTYKKIPGVSGATSVAVGTNFACFTKTDKTVWCWGANGGGQLGDGTGVNSVAAPVKVKGIADATAVVAGTGHACALRASGKVACWGYGSYGQLGAIPMPSLDIAFAPLPVANLTGAVSLAASWGNTCATTATQVKCWGRGSEYQLGDAQVYTQPAPVVAVAGLSQPTMVAIGASSTCEIAYESRVWCWGANSAAETGNGSTGSAAGGAGPGNSFGFALSPRAVPILNGAPGKPTGSSKATKKITISWSAPSTSNGTSAPKDYIIQYRLKGTSTWKTFKDSVSTNRSVTVTGLVKGKYYQFRVQPKNWAGAGKVSAASGYIKSK